MSRIVLVVVALVSILTSSVAAQAQAPAATAANGDLLERVAVSLEPDTLLDGLGEQSKARLSEQLAPIAKTVDLWRIVYQSDGLKVHGYLAMPRGGGDSLPTLIYNRGGSRESGALKDRRAALLLGRLAQQGYVVVASQYRGNGGGEGTEEFGGADVADVLNLIPLLDRLERADASRLGMFGWSRGGMMTFLALARTDRITAAVVGGAITDSFELIERREQIEARVFSQLVPGWDDPAKREAALEARSPVRWADRLDADAPILMLHGASDPRVAPATALAMAGALVEAKRPFRLMMFEDGDHGLGDFRDEVAAAVSSWFDRYVRDGEPPPPMKPRGPAAGRRPPTDED